MTSKLKLASLDIHLTNADAKWECLAGLYDFERKESLVTSINYYEANW